METTYYTLTAREILVEGAAVQRASGDNTRQLVCVRKAARPAPQKEGKVIDLTQWKADREEEARLEDAWYDDADEGLDCVIEQEIEVSAPRTRRSRKRGLTPDLWASAAVVGVMVILGIRLLVGM